MASLLEQTASHFWDVSFRLNFVIYLDNIFNVWWKTTWKEDGWIEIPKCPPLYLQMIKLIGEKTFLKN